MGRLRVTSNTGHCMSKKTSEAESQSKIDVFEKSVRSFPYFFKIANERKRAGLASRKYQRRTIGVERFGGILRDVAGEQGVTAGDAPGSWSDCGSNRGNPGDVDADGGEITDAAGGASRRQAPLCS